MYTPTELKAQASYLNNFIQCNPLTRECFITLRGAAFACAVSTNTVKYALTDSRHRLAKRLNNLGFPIQANVSAESLLSDEVFFYTLSYFATESTCRNISKKKAFALYALVKEIGARNWMQKLVGYKPQQVAQVINPPTLLTSTLQDEQKEEDEAMLSILTTMAQELVKCRTRLNNLEAYLGINNKEGLIKTEPQPQPKPIKNECPYAHAYKMALVAFKSVKETSRGAYYKLNAPLVNLIKAYSESKNLPTLLIWQNLAPAFLKRYGINLEQKAQAEGLTLQDCIANHPRITRAFLGIALETLAY